MATTPEEARDARLPAAAEEGLSSGADTPDAQNDEHDLAANARGAPTLIDLLAMPEAADTEFEPPKARFDSPPVDLSDVLADMPGVGRHADFARSREAEFVARGEQAWADYLRTGQSRPAGQVFDRIQERIHARREWLAENNEALESSNRYAEEHGLPLNGKPEEPK